jgi:hypothetical protein
LKTISGYEVELQTTPKQTTIPTPLRYSDEEEVLISCEIQRFLNTNIIEIVDDSMKEENEYISNIFTRPKKDGRVRIILNLKKFNLECMENIHFKMETLKSATEAMRKDCYFASVDLSEAFYSIPIRKDDRKYFRFLFNRTKYQFTALVMGLTTSPRVFTKLMKPVFASLRAKGFISTAYIDDSCLQGATFNDCKQNVLETVRLMDSLGLTIHPSKSALTPSKQVQFLGFLLCSETMSVSLTPERIQELKKLCQEIIKKSRVTIRQFARLIGKMVAAESGVQYAPLFYKPLEQTKEKYLRKSRGDFNKFMYIHANIKHHIKWWIDNISDSKKLISQGQPKLIIFSDASKKGWGAVDKTNNNRTNGQWSSSEQQNHINILELKACQLALMSLCKNVSNCHVRIYMDNTTSCSYVNKFGGKKSELNSLAREIWQWCLERKIHLSAAHIPGVKNDEADKLSRKFNEDTEWALRQQIFEKILKIFPDMSMDLFASRINSKLSKYVTYLPDPMAFAVDAFTLHWNHELYYIFAPFSLMAKILQKNRRRRDRSC